MLQLLLAGWVMYVGVLGMVVEGILRRKVTADALVGAVTLITYLIFGAAVVHLFLTGRSSNYQNSFHVPVLFAMVWSALQWFRLGRI